jgi:hypothetical protein
MSLRLRTDMQPVATPHRPIPTLEVSVSKLSFMYLRRDPRVPHQTCRSESPVRTGGMPKVMSSRIQMTNQVAPFLAPQYIPLLEWSFLTWYDMAFRHASSWPEILRTRAERVKLMRLPEQWDQG